MKPGSNSSMKPKVPVVERQPENRHVVGIHHPVGEADRLPLGHQHGRAADHLSEHPQETIVKAHELGIVMLDDVLGQRAQVVDLVAVIEDLEAAEADMRRGHANERCPALERLAVDGRFAADDAQ